MSKKGTKRKRSKRSSRKTKAIITGISLLILLILILVGANSEVLNTVSNIAGLNINFEEKKAEEKQDENTNSYPTEFVADSNLNVYFIDVGQADSILVTNGNDSMLIDAGNNDDGKNVVKFIQDKGIQKINYLIRNTSS